MIAPPHESNNNKPLNGNKWDQQATSTLNEARNKKEMCVNKKKEIRSTFFHSFIHSLIYYLSVSSFAYFILSLRGAATSSGQYRNTHTYTHVGGKYMRLCECVCVCTCRGLGSKCSTAIIQWSCNSFPVMSVQLPQC